MSSIIKLRSTSAFSKFLSIYNRNFRMLSGVQRSTRFTSNWQMRLSIYSISILVGDLYCSRSFEFFLLGFCGIDYLGEAMWLIAALSSLGFSFFVIMDLIVVILSPDRGLIMVKSLFLIQYSLSNNSSCLIFKAKTLRCLKTTPCFRNLISFGSKLFSDSLK